MTTVNQIEPLGSLPLGARPGILEDAEIIVSLESEWRDQMIQMVRDGDLADISLELSSAGGNLEERISWTGQQHATVPLFEHLRGIGYQPGNIAANEPSEVRRLILPVGAR